MPVEPSGGLSHHDDTRPRAPQGNEPPATPVPGDFTDATARFRRELLTYCYRMLGSLDEAEDVVQETCPRAWRPCPALEHRSSVRTWLYRIATNACRTACAQKARRPLPTGLPGKTLAGFRNALAECRKRRGGPGPQDERRPSDRGPVRTAPDQPKETPSVRRTSWAGTGAHPPAGQGLPDTHGGLTR
ncbi:sigma factor [Streptomyces sp. CCM_MD2014]|uniref:sigma factor n=1 Tax=Streptomyces sp. CCM_MD2014 TaxID=1561022 RepID=UPI00052A2676|nr:hypothetical protein NI25_25175 [Streptomyces sp. CCM_MD2014]